MVRKNKELRNMLKMLDDIVKMYKSENPEEKRDWRTYEQMYAKRIKTAMRRFEPLINEAVSLISVRKGENRGNESSLTLKQKVQLILLKHIVSKSNREMALMLSIFSLLSDIDISYKTVERLYSDPEVILALHNMHMLVLKEKGIENVDCSGDGTGYSLTISKHYSTSAMKLKDKIKSAKNQVLKSNTKSRKRRLFSYSFTLMDIESRMYIGYGSSFKCEKDAYRKAVRMTAGLDINVESIRLDRYYSNKKDVSWIEENFGKGTKIYLIPKKNATINGSVKWKKMIDDFMNNVFSYLKQYFSAQFECL